MLTWRKTIIAALGSLTLGLWLYGFYFEADLATNRPKEPRPSEERVYCVSVWKGQRRVYVTRIEYWEVRLWMFPPTVFFAIGFLLNRRWHVFP